MHCVAIIPARGGSKGIPGKNLAEFCGKPLLAWTVEQALASSVVDGVYVSSDSPEILAVAEELGATGVTRPAELSGDTTSSESALLHALDWIEQRHGLVDVVVFLQATSPLRRPGDINAAVDKFLADGSDSLFSSALLEDAFIFRQRDGNLVGINFDYKNRPRRQDVEPQYLENGSLWIFRPELLRRENNRMGGHISTYVMELWQSLEIDNLEDLEMAAWYMRRNLLADPGAGDRALDPAAIDLIVYDFDGVMTDNRVWVDETGREAVMVTRADGLGVGLIHGLGIPQVILSTEVNPVVGARAGKLGLEAVQGVENKAAALVEYCRQRGVDLRRVLFLGNDINDRAAMAAVGLSAAPSDAHPEIKAMAGLVLDVAGGQGVVRRLADLLLGGSK